MMLKRKLFTSRVMKRDFGRALLALVVCAVAGAVIIGCTAAGGGSGSDAEGFRITKFMIGEAEGVINQDERTIEVALPYGTDLTKLVPVVEFIGANIDPDAEEEIDFSEGKEVIYTVYSKDSSAFSYSVTVTIEIPNSKEISSFAFNEVTALSVKITDDMNEDTGEDTGIIEVVVPYRTAVDNLTTSIKHSGDSINPVEGQPMDFRQLVTYEVYSLKGEKRTYIVNVTIAENTEADITKFMLNSTESEIFETYITVTMPFGTNLTALVPDITVSDEATVNPASGTANDFSKGAVSYMVTAQDGTTTKTYTVTVNVAKNTAKSISGFTIPGQESSAINEITGDITVALPANMPKNPLTPTIVLSGGTVNPASGTAQNFTNAVKYTVTAADNSTKEYTVTVTNAPATAVTFNAVTANGKSWETETTLLTLQFSADMGDALKKEHITLKPELTKGDLNNKGAGKYELAVKDIPSNDVSVSATVGTNSVYGFTITGSPGATKAFKAPALVNWDKLEVNGADKMQDTTKLTFTFNSDVVITTDDITLSGTSVTKGALSGSGKTWTLAVKDITKNDADLTVHLSSKTGFAFLPGSKTVKVYKELAADADLRSLAVDGYNLYPAFNANVTDYTVTVLAETIQITAIPNDTNAKMVYVENSNATITSGVALNSKKLVEGENAVTVKVTAENGAISKSYKLSVMYKKDVDFPAGMVIDKTFGISTTAQWDDAVNEIKNGGDNKNYVINVTGSFEVAGLASDNTFGNVFGITVVIRGSSSQTISLSSKGNLIHVSESQIIIVRDITLKGWAGNNRSVVSIDANSDFEMRGDAKITGNSGVYVGGGVSTEYSGTFTMRDNSSIYGNSAQVGGGVGALNGSVRIAGGTVYGSDAADGLKNTGTLRSASLDNSTSKAEWGTGGLDGEPWVKLGTFGTVEEKTIKVVNGVKQ